MNDIFDYLSLNDALRMTNCQKEKNLIMSSISDEILYNVTRNIFEFIVGRFVIQLDRDRHQKRKRLNCISASWTEWGSP